MKFIILFWLVFLYGISCNALFGQVSITKPTVETFSGIFVNTYSGNLHYKRSEINMPSRGLDVDLFFSYNNSDRNKNVGFGNGWIFSYGIEYDTVHNGVVVLRADGKKDVFLNDGTGYQSPQGNHDVLEEVETSKFSLRSKEGMILYFEDPSHKKVTRIKDRNGNTIHVQYVNALINKIIDPSGREIMFEWESGLLSKTFIFFENEVLQYRYEYDDDNNMIRAINPKGGDKEFIYGSNRRMETFINENGFTTNIIYNSSGAVKEVNTCGFSKKFSYDRGNRNTFVVSSASSNETIEVYDYDETGRICEKKKDCCGYNFGYTYDEDDNIVKAVDPNGNNHIYEYDSRGNVTFEKNPLGHTVKYGYESTFNRLISKQDRKGVSYNYEYDDNGNRTREILPLGVTLEYTYDQYGNVETFKDGNSGVYIYTYDVNGNQASIEYPDGSKKYAEYDELSREIKTIDERGNVTSFSYDLIGNLVSIVYPTGRQELFDYDLVGNKTSYTNGEGKFTTYTVDGLNRVITTETSLGIKNHIEYDMDGNIVAEIDGEGGATKYLYERGRLVRITNPNGAVKVFSYDINGNNILESNWNGVEKKMEYDVLGRLIKVKDYLGHCVSYAYDNEGNIVTKINEIGGQFQFLYDELGRKIEERDPMGASTIYTYDGNGNQTSIKDASGHVTENVFDAKDRIVKTIFSIGSTIENVYDDSDNLIIRVNENGDSTLYQYGSEDQVLEIKNAVGEVLSYSYNENGSVVQLSSGDNEVVYIYDDDGRLICKKDNVGLIDSVVLDGNGNVTAVYNNSFRAFKYTYDANGKVMSLIDGVGVTVYMEYDFAGNLIKQIDGKGNESRFAYDEKNQLIELYYSDGTTNSIVYDGVGNVLSLKDGSSNETRFTYDLSGRLTIALYPEGGFKNYVYDDKGNIISIESQDQKQQYFEYDELSRLVRRWYSDGSQIDIAYDNLGNKVQVTSEHAELNYSYDKVGRLVSESINGIATQIEYDNWGGNTIERIQYPSGKVVINKYDPRDRLYEVSFEGQNVAMLEYDKDNLLSRVDYGNSTNLDYSYDGNANIISLKHRNDAGLLLSGFDYLYDANNNKISEINAIQSIYSRLFQYDNLNQLIGVTEGLVTGINVINDPINTEDFDYDNSNNRIFFDSPGLREDYIANARNQYTYVNNEQVEYADGNLTSYLDYSFEYNHQNQLVDVEKGDNKIEFQYDGLGRKIREITGLDTIFLYYSGKHIIEEFGADGSKSYVYGGVGEDHMLYMETNLEDGYYYSPDGLGSVAALIDDQGEIVERYKYSSFGKVGIYEPDFNTEITVSKVDNKFCYTGLRSYPTFGIQYNRNRHYFPLIGRFLQFDIVEYYDGLNGYQYVLNNPVNYIDPNGLYAVAIPAGLGLAYLATIYGPAAVSAAIVLIKAVIGITAGVALYNLLEKVLESGLEGDTLEEARKRGLTLTEEGLRNLALTRSCMRTYDKYKRSCKDISCPNPTKGTDCSLYDLYISRTSACADTRGRYIRMGCDNLIVTTKDHPGTFEQIKKAAQNCKEKQSKCYRNKAKCCTK